MGDQTDILDRLRRSAKDLPYSGDLTTLLVDAIAEIERLRAAAGAVSPGDGEFREIVNTFSLPRKERTMWDGVTLPESRLTEAERDEIA